MYKSREYLKIWVLYEPIQSNMLKDIQALNLIDLGREGLSEYKAWLLKYLGGSSTSTVVQ